MAAMSPRGGKGGRGRVARTHGGASGGGGDEVREGGSLTQALSTRDVSTIQTLLGQALSARSKRGTTITVAAIDMEQSRGEQFTGGRSTPVYRVNAHLVIDKNGTTNQKRSRRFVIKHVTVPGSPDDPIVMYERRSYDNETAFYEHSADLVRATGLVIPRVLVAEHTADSFCFLMNDLSAAYPHHPPSLDQRQVRHALAWAARQHANFWGKFGRTSKDADMSWRRALWEQGTFWTLDKPAEIRRLKTHGLVGG